MSKAAFAPFTSFDGKIFENADFRNAQFAQKVSFRNVQFRGKTDFRGANFDGVGDFTEAQFLGDVDFSGSSFTEPLRFDKIKFAGKTSFTDVHFHHDAHFSETEFAGDASFSKTTFHAWALFDHSRFDASLSFAGACLLGSARFGDVEFASDADFRQARFIAYADFSAARFRGVALFSNAAVECKTVFRDTTFSKDVDFSDCRFTHPVHFSNAKFVGTARFERVVFLQFVDFKTAELAEAFVLSLPKGAEGLAPEIRFESVNLRSPEKVRFSNISFERITLMDTNVRGVEFENPKWPTKGLLKATKRAVVYDEIQKEKPDPQKLARLYRDIRANLKKAGTTSDLGDLFYSEMEVRRKQRRGDNDWLHSLRRYFSLYTLLWLTCGYGRRPRRLIVTAAVLGLGYWIIFRT
jgi:uncharacterized protein YjbI with pentapeptide repeats